VAQAAFIATSARCPFGDTVMAHARMAEEAACQRGIDDSGVIEAEGRTNLYALPRIAWDGRQRSLRAMP